MAYFNINVPTLRWTHAGIFCFYSIIIDTSFSLQVDVAVCVVGEDLSLDLTAVGSAFLKKCPSLEQVGTKVEYI